MLDYIFGNQILITDKKEVDFFKNKQIIGMISMKNSVFVPFTEYQRYINDLRCLNGKNSKN